MEEILYPPLVEKDHRWASCSSLSVEARSRISRKNEDVFVKSDKAVECAVSGLVQIRPTKYSLNPAPLLTNLLLNQSLPSLLPTSSLLAKESLAPLSCPYSLPCPFSLPCPYSVPSPQSLKSSYVLTTELGYEFNNFVEKFPHCLF